MKLFDNYLSQIDKVANANNFSSYLGDRTFSATMNESLIKAENPLILTTNNKTVFDFSELIELYGMNKFSITEPTLGNHPDFSYLQMGQHEYYYAVSMFADIKGSTRLQEKYSLEKIRTIKDLVLTAAIHICNFFGGHIQRLQGDGILVYFVRKQQYKNDAIISALNASSLLTQFIKTQLADYFERDGVKPLRLRIGIDYGDNNSVLWSRYGLPMCHELTTTSLHTDLAAKLQAKAASNGIVIGDNIRKELDLPDDFLTIPCDATGNSDYYIYQGSINYRNWIFNWEKYLNTFDFFHKSSDGKRLEFKRPNLRLVCKYKDKDATEYSYYPQNLYSIPKGKDLKFEIVQNDNTYLKKDFETITWSVENRGIEAKNANELSHDLAGIFKNKTWSATGTSYLGHHFMTCKIAPQFGQNHNLRFPIFIQ